MFQFSWKWTLLGWLGWLPCAWGYQLRSVDEGNYVKWHKKEVKYRIHEAMSQDTNKQQTIMVLKKSFAAWQKALGEEVRLTFDGYSQNSKAGYDNQNPNRNENLIFWEEKKWPHNPRTIALTFVTYRQKSGIIVDADIVFNGELYRWMNKVQNSSSPNYRLHSNHQDSNDSNHQDSNDSNHQDSNDSNHQDSESRYLPEIDLANTATHEIGHFLGLAHSQNMSATMYASQPAGETSKRSLHLDDYNAILALYAATKQKTQQRTLPPLPPPPPSWSCQIHDAPQKFSLQQLAEILLLILLASLFRKIRRKA